MKTLLYEEQEKLGAKFYEFGEWTVAKSFDKPWSRGLLDMTFTGVFQVEAPDFLNTQATQDLANLKNGFGLPSAFTDRFGKVLGLSLVYKLDDLFFLWCYSECFQKLYLHILQSAKLANIKVIDPRLAVLGIFDPEDKQQPNTIIKEGENYIAKHPTMPLKLIFTNKAKETYESLLSSSQPMGWQDFNMERIKAGELIYGIDIDETFVFPEHSLKSYVSFTKGCYLGQEIVSRLHTYNGMPPKLPVKIKSELPIGEKIIIDGKEAGVITSSEGGFVIATIKKEFVNHVPKTSLEMV